MLLLLIAGGIYLGVMFVPVYVDNFTVKEAVTVAHNRIAQGADDESIRNVIMERTSRLGYHWERDRFDQNIRVPGLGLQPEQIIVERSMVTPSVKIQVDYERRVRFAPSKYVRTIRFRVVREGIPGQR
ncbi:hypothetical protein [Archangium sp.]|uniref:hypothetical protein n=1 Tax=Archangium sp. TaxID=1872627 RepID=UPI00286D3A35|nr:hypothetical protein [Archangium sp.]